MFMNFTPRKSWVNDKECRTALALRIAHIIGYTGDDSPPYEKQGEPDYGEGYNWTLNISNDWWLHIEKGGNVELHYRYKWSDEQWKALQTVIEMFVSKPKEDE